jgi:ubiquitin-protein ligase
MPGRGVKQLREDIARLPLRYHCNIDREMPEHCSAEVDGVALGIWMDDVSLYPAKHVAKVFPVEDSQRRDGTATKFPPMLESIEVSGEISEMLLMISDIISSSTEPEMLDSEMTEPDNENGDDESEYGDSEDTWHEDMTIMRCALVKRNCELAQSSDLWLLQDTQYMEYELESLIWTRIRIEDLIEAGIFSQMEADTWGLSVTKTLWMVFHLESGEGDYTLYLRQADHDIPPRDIVKNLVRKTQVLCVLEAYVRKNVFRMLENTVEYTGKLILERLPEISKYCSICGDKSVDIPSVKPFCCSNNLCQFQFMYVDLNGELEDMLLLEPDVVDVLIQLAYVAARNNALNPYPDCLDGLDSTSPKNSGEICDLLNKLPFVAELAKFAAVPNGLSTHLKTIDARLLPLLRWIVMSNTAHISHLEKQEQMIAGLGKTWLQFKMLISTPEKEHIFQQHKIAFEGKSIFAFHGSPLHNWHSILRTGLHFKNVVNGRAYGHGIYHAFDINTSIGYCGTRWHSGYNTNVDPKVALNWRKAAMDISLMLSVNEVILDPSCYVCDNPFLVVNDPEKVQTRYLVIQGYHEIPADPKKLSKPPKAGTKTKPSAPDTKLVESEIYPQAPVPGVKYNNPPAKYSIFNRANARVVVASGRNKQVPKESSNVWIPEDGFSISTAPTETHAKRKNVPLNRLELPHYASRPATKHLHQELSKLLKEKNAKDAVFQLDRARLDNLYEWTVYLTNFAPDLPLAQDLERLSLDHVEISIVFGDKTPLTPPFVRVVQPRFVAFSHGGGGHVTAGGSICTSFLTMEDWSPVYSISQVLIMVHSALSSVDPRPARIADKGCYNEREAMEAYVRVAATHGWRVPEGFNELFVKKSY